MSHNNKPFFVKLQNIFSCSPPNWSTFELQGFKNITFITENLEKWELKSFIISKSSSMKNILEQELFIHNMNFIWLSTLILKFTSTLMK